MLRVVEVGGNVHRDHDVGPEPERGEDRDLVHPSPVDEEPAVQTARRKDSRDGRARCGDLAKPSMAQDDLLRRLEVHRRGRETDRRRRDLDVGKNSPEAHREFLGGHERRAHRRHAIDDAAPHEARHGIEEAPTGPLGLAQERHARLLELFAGEKRPDASLDLGDVAHRRVGASHDGAHARPGDDVDRDALANEGAKHADVGEPSRRAPSERESDLETPRWQHGGKIMPWDLARRGRGGST